MYSHELCRAPGQAVETAYSAACDTLVVYGQNVVPQGLSNVVQIAAGAVHSLAFVGNERPVSSAALHSARWTTNGFSVSLPTKNGRVYVLEFKTSLNDAK